SEHRDADHRRDHTYGKRRLDPGIEAAFLATAPVGLEHFSVVITGCLAVEHEGDLAILPGRVVVPAESKVATTYPTEEQYQRWKNKADSLDMSTSEFIQSMTEAGM